MEAKSYYSGKMNLVEYIKPYQNDGFEKILEALSDLELKCLASELTDYGLSFSDNLSDAIERAIKICYAAQVPIKQNFKPVYICNNGEMICDWRLSPLGKKLVILNADPTNPLVAKLQVQLLKNRI